MRLAALALALSACCPAPRLVPVVPRPCLTRAAPRPPTADSGPAHAAHYASLVRWAIAAELSCGVHAPGEDAPFEDVH